MASRDPLSPYFNSDLVVDPGELKPYYTVFSSIPDSFPYAEREDTIRYVTKEGDRLDHLSTAFYGTPKLWWVIADFQSEPIHEPLEVSGGIHLLIPSPSYIRDVFASTI